MTDSDFLEEFEEFLETRDGEVTAVNIVTAWNTLAQKYGWKDRIEAVLNLNEKVLDDEYNFYPGDAE